MHVRVWAVVVVLVAVGALARVVSTSAEHRQRASRPVLLTTEWGGGSDRGLHVLPFPGTPDASPASQVIFSALTQAAVRSVSVVGARSGRHVGHLVELPGGAGTAFVPRRRFLPRESVEVRAVLRSAAAGTASGAPGATRLHFSFRVRGPVGGLSADSGGAGAPAIRSGPRPPTPPPASPGRVYSPQQHFHSNPGLQPPVVHETRDFDPSLGDILITPNDGRQHGPMILSPRGGLVWFDHISNNLSVYNLAASTYAGKPVLTWWQGRFANAHGTDGQGVIMDDSYRIVNVVRAGNGYTSDLHEFQVTPQGTAWIDCYVPVHANLTREGGSAHGTVLDGVIQKIDIRTGRVLWEWHSLGHVPLSSSEIGAGGGGQYDYLHLNSIQPLPDGKVLVSGRNTWAVYLVDERTGRVDWTLGGKDSNFRFGRGAGFAWQHDVTLNGRSLLTVFDNAAVPQREASSSAKLLRLNVGARRASLVRRYVHSPPVTAGFMGSAQLLPDHRMFVGWGSADGFTEYSAGARRIFSGSFEDGVNSYRAYRFPWHGEPSTPPNIAVAAGSGGALRVYSSWNGATDVARWRVLGGTARDALAAVGEAAKRGFETGQWIHAHPRYLAVEGLDAQGRVLGRSTVVRAPGRGRG